MYTIEDFNKFVESQEDSKDEWYVTDKEAAYVIFENFLEFMNSNAKLNNIEWRE